MTSPDDSIASLVWDDPAIRLQRMAGLAPKNGLGVGRRAILLALITWLPVAVWAVATGHVVFQGAGVPESLLGHFGVQIRCLVAIPLFIIAEGIAHSTTAQLVPYFLTSGIVPPEAHDRFEAIVTAAARRRRATIPWVLILGATIAITVAVPTARAAHDMEWAHTMPGTENLTFGGNWAFYVARPVFIALALAWLWRLVLLFILLRQVAKLPLALVATHPDRAGGLGFLDLVPRMFSPVILAFSAVVSARWAHEVAFHGVKVTSLQPVMIAFVVVAAVLFLAPFLVFIGPLVKLKRRAELEYGSLVGRHGRMVHQRWVSGEDVEDGGLLSAPELGPVADTLTLFQAIRGVRPFPLGGRGLASLIAPAVIPMIFVIAIQVPIKQLLLSLLKAIA